MTAPRPGGARRTVACVGAGPAGLLAATRIKTARPDWHVVVHERAPKDVTYGYGVVFSDIAVRTIAFMVPSLGAVLASQVTWQDVEVRANGRRHRSGGHGYIALSRHRLLAELAGQALDAGVELRYETPVAVDALRSRYDLVVAADGARSRTRSALAAELGARVRYGRSRFVWLGTSAVFDAMTFIFEETPEGLAIAHGYPHGDGRSTFVVEVPCSSDGPGNGAAAGGGPDGRMREELERALDHWSRVFAEHLYHRPLLAKDLRWAHFPTVHLDRCVHENVVLIGDAAHTAHYSVGSGTRLALEDAFLLGRALERDDDLGTALAEYERRRLPGVQELRVAGERSMRWFERAPVFLERPAPQFAVHLLSRASLPSLEKVEADAPELVEEAKRELAGGTPLPSAGILALPLEVGAVRLPGRLVREGGSGGSWCEDCEDQRYGCLLATADGPADTGPAWQHLPRGTVVVAERVPLVDRAGAAPPLVVIDMGPCPTDPAQATAGAEALVAAAHTAGWPMSPAVAVRTGFTDVGGTAVGGAVSNPGGEALLARLRVMRSAGLCDLVDLAARSGGPAEPDALLDVLEHADTVRSALGVPIMLSGFQARPDQIATHVLAGRIDAWCVSAPD
ncbi:FAD-dependent monooxygenase [Streptomyces noboritoensis]|uniref:FAD-dependent monooxygenase n=1 Tax=Streptomyces noboritoensis TaxID=67337 RepID=A0ABV6TEE5_9ACTN